MQRENLGTIETLVSHIFRHSDHTSVERMAEGVSTEVYRIRHNDAVFYLRILPEQNASFAPEVLVHRLLRAKNVHVPDVVYFEHYNPALQRSVMMTTEIPGAALGYHSNPHDLKGVLIEAGKELAIINSVPVHQFGWIRRDGSAPMELQGEIPTYREFIHQYVDEHVAFLGRARVLRQHEVQAIQEIIAHYNSYLGVEQAYLAHGDFDVTHIYQQNSAYTGIIDFGEIRGANPLYDLGHFQVESRAGFPYLLEGYGAIAQLPRDYTERIHFSSLFIAIGRLGRRVKKHPGAFGNDPDLLSIRSGMKMLLA